MTPGPVSEQEILEALRRVPPARWHVVLAQILALQPAAGEGRPIRTAAELLQSGAVGVWADRDDVGDSRAFAGRLRRED